MKDLVLNKLEPIVVGEDPLNADKLYTKMLMQSAGAIGGVTMAAASGIEIALWDLCGRFRDRVRFGRPRREVGLDRLQIPGATACP